MTGNFLTTLEEGPSYDVNGDYSDDESELDSDEYDEDDSFIDDESEDDSDLENPKIEEIKEIKKERKNIVKDSEEEPEIEKSLKFESKVGESDSEEIDSDDDFDSEDDSEDNSDDNSDEMDSEDDSEPEVKVIVNEKRSAPVIQTQNKKGRQDPVQEQQKSQSQPSKQQMNQKQSTPQKNQPQQSSTPQKNQPQQGPTPQKNQPQKNSTPQKNQETPIKQSTPVSAEKNQGVHKKSDSTPSTPQKEGTTEFKKISGGVEIKDVVNSTSDKKVKKGSKVHVIYKGSLANGKVFDSNDEKKLFPFQLGKNQVIKGLEIGVEGMALNSTRIIKIPAELAYGNKKIPGIPPNSELTFHVQLKRID